MNKTLIQFGPEPAGSTACSTFEAESRLSYPGMIFVYPDKLDETQLRQSLTRVLSDFPQYAGRLVSNGTRLSIRHAAAAVSFETQHSRDSIETWIDAIRAGRRREIEPRVSTLRV